jgi:hypothetical protein
LISIKPTLNSSPKRRGGKILPLNHTIFGPKSKHIMVASFRLITKVRNKEPLSITKDAMDNEKNNVALFLRGKIQKLREKKLPNPITVEAIHDGQCIIPTELSDFYRVLYTVSKASERVERYIESSAEDDIYKSTSGTVKPSI